MKIESEVTATDTDGAFWPDWTQLQEAMAHFRQVEMSVSSPRFFSSEYKYPSNPLPFSTAKPSSSYCPHSLASKSTNLPTFTIMLTPFTTLFTIFMSLLAVAVSLPLSAHIEKRDVFVPPILYPHAGTIWIAGQHYNVTWDTRNAPVNITNKYGMIYLRNNSLIDMSMELASDFNILDGRVEIQVPRVSSGHNYSIVLFGDSGNWSPDFTILAKSK